MNMNFKPLQHFGETSNRAKECKENVKLCSNESLLGNRAKCQADNPEVGACFWCDNEGVSNCYEEGEESCDDKIFCNRQPGTCEKYGCQENDLCGDHPTWTCIAKKYNSPVGNCPASFAEDDDDFCQYNSSKRGCIASQGCSWCEYNGEYKCITDAPEETCDDKQIFCNRPAGFCEEYGCQENEACEDKHPTWTCIAKDDSSSKGDCPASFAEDDDDFCQFNSNIRKLQKASESQVYVRL